MALSLPTAVVATKLTLLPPALPADVAAAPLLLPPPLLVKLRERFRPLGYFFCKSTALFSTIASFCEINLVMCSCTRSATLLVPLAAALEMLLCKRPVLIEAVVLLVALLAPLTKPPPAVLVKYCNGVCCAAGNGADAFICCIPAAAAALACCALAPLGARPCTGNVGVGFSTVVGADGAWAANCEGMCCNCCCCCC